MSQALEGEHQAHVSTIIPTLSVTSGKDCVLEGLVNGVPTSILIDTGAATSVLSKDLWDKAKGSGSELGDAAGRKLVSVQGKPLQLYGSACVQLQLAAEKFPVEVMVAEIPTIDMIIGRDFLRNQECTIEMGKASDVLHVKSCGLKLPISKGQPSSVFPTLSVILQESVKVPPFSEMEVMGSVPAAATSKTWVVQGKPQGRNAVMVARALVLPEACSIPLRLLNPRDEEVTIPRGTAVAELENVVAEVEGVPPGDVGVAVVSDDEEAGEPTEAHRKRLWELVEQSEQCLSQGEKEQLFALLLEYHDIFATGPHDLGQTGRIQHTINTGTAQPIRQQVRRVPQFRRQEAKKLLDDMLGKGVIQPSDSPWASPVVLVPKKDGSLRFCVDYRRVNSVTRRDAYPLPRVDDTLDTLAGSKLFSTLDMLSGYWQVEVDPKDREKTAFCTPEGLFEFRVMPFGLCNAPATFQRLMDAVLAGLQWSSCLVYLDDLVIPGKTFLEHLAHLRNVFQRLREAGLKLKPSKCNFCLKKVEFLGHVVSAEGVRTDPGKTEKVATWPVPMSKRDVQQFLGLANYYRRFVKDFTTVAKPLHHLTEKTAKFEWTEKAQNAFEELRRRLVTAPVLEFPDYSKPFTLDTDASDTGIGAVLSQSREDGSECVVAYASRVLTRPERQYCVTRKELLAVVTFVQHFRCYLLGREFQLRTDHGSLTWLANFKEPEGQLARWLERLQEFHFCIVHRPGKRHGNADSLSRRPCSQCGRDSHEETSTATIPVPAHSPIAVLVERSPQDLRKLQLEDGPISLLLQAVEKGEKPDAGDVRQEGPEAQRLLQLWERLLADGGLLKRKYEDSGGNRSWQQLVVPHTLREEIMRELHSGALEGHLGVEKTVSKIKERFYWPGMHQEVDQWIRTCPSCATRKSAPQRNRGPLQTIKAGYPLQVVAVDILGPLMESVAGNSYILVAGDYFTKWMEAYAIPNQEAVTVARKLVDQMFCRFSPPEQLHSDQGKQFESAVLHEVCNILGMKKTRTSPYHPQCDGLVERYNRTLLDMLATTTQTHPFDWEDQLPKVCMAYNTSVHASTGYTPFFLMFGRQARMPIDLMYGMGNEKEKEVPTTQYAAATRKALEEAYRHVREKLAASHVRRKAYYDKRVHGRPFAVGDLVWLHSVVVPQGKSKKLHHPWTGPFQVLTKLSDSDYRVKKLTGNKRVLVVHFNRLKLCTPGTRFDVEVPDSVDGEDPPLSQDATPYYFGADMEPLEYDDVDEPDGPTEPRYPRRDRAQPEWYGSYIEH